MEQKIKDFSKWLDERLPFNKWIGGFMGIAAEAVDGRVFAGLFSYAVSKVDPVHHPKIEAALDAVLNKDYEALKKVSTEELVTILKTPLGDARERIIIAPQMEVIAGLIQYEIDNGEAETKSDEKDPGQGPGDPDPD